MDFDEWNFEARNLAAFLIPGVVIPAILLVLAFLQPTRRQMSRWAAVCGVTLTDTNREQVRWHLARVRRFRSMAAFPFWWLAWLPFINAGYPSRFATPLPAIAAYLAGALLAEVTGNRVRTPATAERRAALLTRSMDDYATAWTQRLPSVLLLTGALAVMAARYLEGPGHVTESAVIVALATVFTAVALLAGHRIVRRPQRGSEPDVLAADDALRATGISTAYAAAALIALLAASTGMGSVLDATEPGPWWLLLIIPGVLAVQGLTIGLLTLVIRQETLGYRRRHRQARTTTSAVLA